MSDIEELLERGAGDSPGGFTAADVERRARKRNNRRQMMSSVALLLVLGLGLAAVATMTGDRDQPVATGPDPSTPGTQVTADDLVGGRWKLVGFNGRDMSRGDSYVQFGANGQATGIAFCNSFAFPWSITAGQLSVEGDVEGGVEGDVEGDGVISMSLVGCGEGEMELLQLLGGGRVERIPGTEDSISLHRDGTTATYTRVVHTPSQANLAHAFQVVHAGEMRGGGIGMLGSATTPADLGRLWEDLGLDGVAGLPEVDFEQQVVVSIIIPDDACPPELVRFDTEEGLLTPVFEQPPGACRLPLRPKVYVVALSHELAPPGSVLRYPDDEELQTSREGPLEIRIWPQPDGQSGTDEEAGPATEDAALVQIYFTPEELGQECTSTSGVMRQRPVDDTVADALPFVLEELLAGPTSEEQAAGLTSWFSEETAGMLQSVDVSDGIAHVSFENFAPLLNNASTSCGSASLMSSLDRTVTQFSEIDKAVYYFDGDAEPFYTWLQGSPPPEARPSAWATYRDSRNGRVELVSGRGEGPSGRTFRVLARSVDGERVIDVATVDGRDWRTVSSISLPQPGYPIATDRPVQVGDVTRDGQPDFLIPLDAAQKIGVVISSADGDWRVLPVQAADEAQAEPYLGLNPRIQAGQLISDGRSCEPSCAEGGIRPLVWRYGGGVLSAALGG